MTDLQSCRGGSSLDSDFSSMSPEGRRSSVCIIKKTRDGNALIVNFILFRFGSALVFESPGELVLRKQHFRTDFR